MTIDPMDRNFQLTGCIEDGFVSVPIAPPLFVVANAVQKFLFGDSARHPSLEDVLASRKNGLDRKCKIEIPPGKFPDELCRVVLASG